MTIDKLSSSALKIYLDTDDFLKYNIDSTDINISVIKKFLIEISDDISEILNIDAGTARLYVEVFSRKNSCIIFVSDISDTLQQKNKNNSVICEFNNYKSLESFCRTLSALYKDSVRSSTLFCGSYRLRLLLNLENETKSIIAMASGYCNIIPADEINLGVISEYYKEIISENAVSEILFSISK